MTLTFTLAIPFLKCLFTLVVRGGTLRPGTLSSVPAYDERLEDS